MNQIMSILDSYGFRSLVWDVFVERIRVPAQGGDSDEARIHAGLAVAEKCLSAMSDFRNNQAWLAGSELSLADLHAYPMVTLFRLAPEGASLLENYPGLIEWYQRFAVRESARATRHPLEADNNE